MGIFEIISLILNLLLGSGMIVTLLTLKSTKEKAAADAKGAEINNVDAVAKMWRELAEKMSEQYTEVSEQVDKLTKEVNKLRSINSKIVRLLDRITPENMLEMVEKIKQEINQGEENNHTTYSDVAPIVVQSEERNADSSIHENN
jgi:archaellum component FlaC